MTTLFLRAEKDFVRATRRGRKYTSHTAFAKYFYNQDLGIRVGIVIPKSIAPKAVMRNRVKRVFREAVRLDGPGAASMNFDIVIFPGRNALDCGLDEAREFLKGCLAAIRREFRSNQ